ncbi:MAG: hypothetical protein IJX43_01710 [Alphaproteobacteria bacterium]|nr:hypothetical protein [Alphaproteobacteria bacterium]
MPNLNVGLSLAMCCINTASAYLMVSAGSSPGSWCYSDCTTEGMGCMIVVSCNCDDGVSVMDDCSTSDSYYTCYLGSSGGVDYYCDYGNESACSLCGCIDGYITDWTSTSTTGVVQRTYQSLDDDYDSCYASTHSHYGCAEGYYMSSGSSTLLTAMLSCARCPSFQTTSGTVYGNTSEGNRSSATACYLSSGTTSSFSDTIGSGTQKFTSTCYYSN